MMAEVSADQVSADGESFCDMSDISQILDELSQITPVTDEYDEAVKKLLIADSLMLQIKEKLQSQTKDLDDTVKSAKLIAELAKSESARETLLECGVVSMLVPLINSSNKGVSLQCVRALGNMCYEQDSCRERIVKIGGLNELESLMTYCLSKHNSHCQLKTACCGFLHNLLNGNETCQKAMLSSNMVSIIKSMIEMNAGSTSICNFCYMALSSIAEVEGGRECLYKSGVMSTLVRMFVNTNIKDTDDLLINLISSLTADSDEMKLLLAESSVDMHLLRIISLLSSSTDDDDQLLVKNSSELLVLVLTGDEAMKIWFDGGNGFVFTSVCEWLHSSNGQLLQSAAFALGNFARDDENSMKIIQRGVSLELFKCLDQLHGFRNDSRTAPTIHAVLSALRNLAIASVNKVQLLRQDILSRILPYMDCENTVVTSKLVGVLRLIIDKNEQPATTLGNDELVVKRLISFSNCDQNMLLKGESTRCLAWIIKNSRDKTVLKNLLALGSFPHLVFLVSSEHAVMQNEGLISIILLFDALPEQTKAVIRDSELLSSLTTILCNDKLPVVEVTQNILMLVNQLAAKGLCKEIRQSKLVEVFDNVKTNYNLDAINNLIDSISNYVNDTAVIITI